MESARNLTILLELMHVCDRILRDSESTPGESNNIERINDDDVQKPFDINQFSQLFTRNGENTTISCMYSINPLSNSSTSCGSDTTAVTTASNRRQESTDTSKNQQQEQVSQMIKNYICQLDKNVRLIQDVVNKPYMQSLMNLITINPNIPRQMVANNPKLYEQIIDTLSATMKKQMRNLDVNRVCDMLDEVIAMRKQHLAKLNRECVRRYRQRKRQQDINEYKRIVREQKRRYRKACRLKGGKNGKFNNDKNTIS